jgi:hypothetical protein
MINNVGSLTDFSVYYCAESFTAKKLKKYVVSPLKKGIDFAEIGLGVVPKERLSAFRNVLASSSRALSFIELPKKLNKICRHVTVLYQWRQAENVAEVGLNLFNDGTSVVNSAGGLLTFANDEGLLTLSGSQLIYLNALGLLGSVAVTAKSAQDLKKTVGQFWNNPDPQQQMPLLIDLICRISALALGIFGILTFACGGELIVKGVILGISLLSLSLSICKYFYSNLYLNPTNKDI